MDNGSQAIYMEDTDPSMLKWVLLKLWEPANGDSLLITILSQPITKTEVYWQNQDVPTKMELFSSKKD